MPPAKCQLYLFMFWNLGELLLKKQITKRYKYILCRFYSKIHILIMIGVRGGLGCYIMYLDLGLNISF